MAKKNNYYDYTEGKFVSNARQRLADMAGKSTRYYNSFSDQLNDTYNQIRNGKQFNYSPDSDMAYRRFADEYNALSGLAITDNQQQAQGLTGGYGSSYAAEVANQGLARMRDSAANAQPLFMQQAQEAYKANNDRLQNMYEAAANARNDELKEYANRADAYNNQYNMAQKQYADNRDYDYKKFSDNRDFKYNQEQRAQEQSNIEKEYQFKIYDTYQKLAAEKCADYKEKMNNSGMRAYLDGLVKAGKLTKYLADNLYKQYKYTAPKSRGGGRSRGSSKSSGSGSEIFDTEAYIDNILKDFTPDPNVIKYINMRNRDDNLNTAYDYVDILKKGAEPKLQLSEEEAKIYKLYFKRMYE